MMNSVVSIIIPVFNGEKHLSATIRSALDQSWPDKQIIVVDDGSEDDSLAIAKRYENRDVEVVSMVNSGASAARNVGLEIAEGKYIQYLDADDLLSKGKIQKQVGMLEPLPDGYVASCPWGKFSRHSRRTEFSCKRVWQDFADPVEWLITSWEGGGMMADSCWLIPATVAREAGQWDETLKENPADDGEYFSRVLLASEGVKFCPGARVYYREPGRENVSQNVSPRAIQSLFMNCERYREHVLPVEDSPRVRHALAVNYARFIYRFHPDHPELIAKARDRIRELGFDRAPVVGGRKFRLVARIAGFEKALRVRELLKRR
jgi:glycosyltransferase involved in cell wall biosynthesis